MFIKSFGFEKNDKSGIEHNKSFYEAKMGVNIYTFNDNQVINVTNYNTHEKNETEQIIKYVNDLFVSDIEYIIFITSGDAAWKLDIDKLIISCPNLGLQKMKILSFGDSYYFLFYVIEKKLIYEKLSEQRSIIDMYSFLDGKLSRGKTKYLVCNSNIFKFFREYIESLKDKLNLIYLILEDVTKYDYIDDENELYIFLFGQSIDENLMQKKFNKLLINTEQMTRKLQYEIIKKCLKQNIRIIDYSIENVEVVKSESSYYLPYQYNENEINKLKNYYQTIPKLFDVAFCGATSIKRKNIINQLKSLNISVLEVGGWDDFRDKTIASCRVLLNIHYDNDYNIYESIRCDRWAFATMPVISEDSINSDLLDVNKHNIVYFYKYNDLVTGMITLLKNIKYPEQANIDIVRKERDDAFNGLFI